MYQAPEQFAALSKANLEAAARFANVAFGGAERLVEIQLKAAKAALADGVDGAKTLSTIKDLQSSYENLQVTQPAQTPAMVDGVPSARSTQALPLVQGTLEGPPQSGRQRAPAPPTTVQSSPRPHSATLAQRSPSLFVPAGSHVPSPRSVG